MRYCGSTVNPIQMLINEARYAEIKRLYYRCLRRNDESLRDFLNNWLQVDFEILPGIARIERDACCAPAIIEGEPVIATKSGCFELDEAFGIADVPSPKEIDALALLIRTQWMPEDFELRKLKLPRFNTTKTGASDDSRSVD